jgi:hypothetical protein
MATYEPDRVGFGRMMMGDEMGDLVVNVANQLAAEMRISAPRGSEPKMAGQRYADNFSVETGLDLAKEDRRAAFVVNDSRYATALEVGSWNIKNPPQPMLRTLQRFAVT